jgi:Leucine-rich repeat (LRR) protein
MTSAAQKLAARLDAAAHGQSDELDLSGLGLKTLPALPAGLQSLSRLDLSRNRLATIPADVFALLGLEQLDLGGNRLTEVPPDVGRLNRLAKLDLSENDIGRLPAELLACPELRDLSLYANALASLPLEGVRNDMLRSLDVSCNRLTSLDGVATAFPGLRVLDASGNRLELVDDSLPGLGSLRILNLSNNSLTAALPLAAMPWLVELSLDDNRLAAIPPAIADFASLRVFSAERNPVGTLPPAFDRVGALALKRDARSAFAAHVSGGGEAGKHYFDAPSLFFDFALALNGTLAVLRFVDLYFKRSPAVPKAAVTMRFPDGSVIELSNLSRKATLDLVRQHKASLAGGRTAVQLGPTRAGHEGSGYELLAKTVASVPSADVVGKATGATYVTFVNSSLVQNIHSEVSEMGDRIVIDRNSGNLNLKSQLQNVTQTIGSSAAGDDAKKELTALVNQLSEALAKVPDAQKLDAEAVSDAAEEVVTKATKPNPNKKSVDISAKGLLEAAKGIVDVIPIATSIVQAVGKLAGLG